LYLRGDALSRRMIDDDIIYLDILLYHTNQ
jgi:hypothetical protein